MRPIWNGMLAFGLVNIPVGVYPATEESDLHLHLLHKEDNGRIRNQRVCSVDGEAVDYDDLVRAYEYEKGKYVTLTDEDLEKVKVAGTDKIVIDDFVECSEIDARFFERPYYLLPGKNSDAPYALLREALKETGKVGIARIVLRTRERLAAIRPDGSSLMLETMHFADELREVEGPKTASSAIGKREMDMAKMLIQAMSSKFEPSRYHDTYKEAMMEMIHQKIDGKEIVSHEEHVEPTQVIDLMKYLKASIDKSSKTTETGDKPEAGEKKPPRRKSPARHVADKTAAS